MAASRKLYEQFTAAVTDLNDIPPQTDKNQSALNYRFNISSSYLSALNDDEVILGRLFSAAEYARRTKALSDCTTLVQHMMNLRGSLLRTLGDTHALPNHDGLPDGLLGALRSRVMACYRHLGTLTQEMLADGRYNEKQITLMSKLAHQMEMVYENPTDAAGLAELNTLHLQLDSLLETGSFSHYAYVAGRALFGAIEAALGLAIMVASLATTIGLALTIGTAVVTWLLTDDIHWGPLTLGNQLFWYGADTFRGGPTLFQRNEAMDLSNCMKLMKTKTDEIVAQMPAGPQP